MQQLYVCVCASCSFAMETAIHILHTAPGQGWGDQDAANPDVGFLF